MRTLALAAWIVLVCHASGGMSHPSRVFEVEGRAPRHAVAMAPWGVPPDTIPESPMLRQIQGVVAVLGARELALLRRSIQPQTRPPEDLRVHQTIAVLHLTAGEFSTRVLLGRVDHGWILARSLDQTVAARLDQAMLAPLLASWNPPRPDPALAESRNQGGVVARLDPPFTPSPIRLDRATVSTRLARGGSIADSRPVSRDLPSEGFTVRLPSALRPDRPAGMLVWCGVDRSLEIPPELAEAADALTLITVTPGNLAPDRALVDRLQLALDAVATVSSRWWTDPTRVYTGGIGDGARLASVLWSGFPDVFAGGVGVAGLDSHHDVDRADGRRWAKSHDRPAGELGRAIAGTRFAIITGPRDPAFAEIRARVDLLRRDQIQARVFDFADQAAERIVPERLRLALEWADEPWRESRGNATREAQALLNAYKARHQEGPPRDDRAVKMLERVTIAGPFTEPAWTAAAWLGVQPSTGAGEP
jgi:hypothetical protein